MKRTVHARGNPAPAARQSSTPWLPHRRSQHHRTTWLAVLTGPLSQTAPVLAILVKTYPGGHSCRVLEPKWLRLLALVLVPVLVLVLVRVPVLVLVLVLVLGRS